MCFAGESCRNVGAFCSFEWHSRAVSGLFFLQLERQREETRRNGAKGRTEAGGGRQGVSESAVSAQTALGLWFGAKPAQSETPVRAIAKRRPPGKRTQWNKDA